MIEVEYLTIAEFAECVGITKQAVYKQVNNENSQIAPFVLREGKKTLIKVSALKELYDKELDSVELNKVDNENSTLSTPIEVEKVETTTPKATADNPTKQPDNPKPTPNNQPLSTDYIEFLKNQIAELKAEKVESEQRLNATIREKDEIIKEQSAQLAQLAQQVAQIADKALIATSQQQYLTAMEKGEKVDSVSIEPNAVGLEKEEENKSSETQKKSLFKRLFRL